MVDEDSDEEFVSWAAVVSCLLFSIIPPKAAAHISRVAVWRVSCLLFLIPQLYKLAVFFFVLSGGSGMSTYNILLSAC